MADGGKLIRKFAESNDFFLETCGPLFARMVDTVPRGVQLTDVITPIQVKPKLLRINVDKNGTMTVSGRIRVKYTTF